LPFELCLFYFIENVFVYLFWHPALLLYWLLVNTLTSMTITSVLPQIARAIILLQYRVDMYRVAQKVSGYH